MAGNREDRTSSWGVPLVLTLASAIGLGVIATGAYYGTKATVELGQETAESIRVWKEGVDRTEGMGTFLAVPLIVAAVALVLLMATWPSKRRGGSDSGNELSPSDDGSEHGAPWGSR